MPEDKEIRVQGGEGSKRRETTPDTDPTVFFSGRPLGRGLRSRVPLPRHRAWSASSTELPKGVVRPESQGTKHRRSVALFE